MMKNRFLVVVFFVSLATLFTGCDLFDEPDENITQEAVATDTAIKGEEPVEKIKNPTVNEDTNIHNEAISDNTEDKTQAKEIEAVETMKEKEEQQVEVATATINNTIVEEDKGNNEDNIEEKKLGEDGGDGIRIWSYEGNLAEEIFAKINEYRSENGVTPLKWSNKEWERADESAQRDVENAEAYHDFLQISLLTNMDDTAEQFVQRWKNSATHNRSLLNSNYKKAAVSMYRDNTNCYYVVVSFDNEWDDGTFVEVPIDGDTF